jgi:SpoVK/Ycf46/Vps4 family AAA+-type ATPase
MIARAEEDNADPADIIKIIQQIDSKGLADLISKKYSLENKIKILREQALSPSLKNTNPELYVDLTNNSNTGFNVYLIELSHIEDVAQNWRAAFDLNNIFLTHGTFNRRQQFIDRKLTSLLNKFSKAKNLNEKKLILKELRKVEEELVEKNLISKHGDRYFGADMDKVVNEANLLKNVEEAVDYTRYLADGGLVSFEEVLEYDND